MQNRHPPITELLSDQVIAERVAELAREISARHVGEELVLVGVLKGAWVFLADLIRRLSVPTTVEFIAVSSYGASTESSGVVKITTDLRFSVEGKHVLLVEDILDTGLTLQYIIEHLRMQRPASLEVCVLLDKPARRRVEVDVDYVGFEIPDRFVVGYGVDYAEFLRNLPYVGYITEPASTDEEGK